MHEIADLLKQVLSQEELEKLAAAPLRERYHPVGRLLSWHESLGQEYGNTLFALKAVLKSDPEWLRAKQRKRRLLDKTKYHNPDAVLSELRAYGALLEAGFSVHPVRESKVRTPDFEICDPDGGAIEIEVFSKGYPDEESEALDQFHNAPPPEKGPVVVCEHSVRPFGTSKSGLNHPATVAKVLGMKKRSGQLSGACPGILWIDLQGELWRLYPWDDACLPLTVDRTGFHSGGLWYSLFGRKGDPVFERYAPWPLDLRAELAAGMCKMENEGRFLQDPTLSAVVVSCEGFLSLFENPEAAKGLGEWFWLRVTALRLFDMSRSWIGWPENELRARLDIERRRICALGRAIGTRGVRSQD